MNTVSANLETEIIDFVFSMNRQQQEDMLDYAGKIKNSSEVKEKYRREAMRQIREALASI